MTEMQKLDYLYKQDDSLKRTSVPFSLRMQPEVCKRIAQELRVAVCNAKNVTQELLKIRIDTQFFQHVSKFKTQLNKYVLIKSDCSWQHDDADLARCLGQLEMCYGLLMKKYSYELGDLIYAYSTLLQIVQVFEAKIEAYEAVYSAV